MTTHSTASAKAPTNAPANAARDEPIPLGPLAGDVRPTHEALALEIDPASDGFRGTAEIALHLAQPRRAIWMHGRGLAVSSATLTATAGATAGAAVPVRWEQVDDSGVVRVTAPTAIAGDAVLRVAFAAKYDPQLVGVYRVQTRAGAAVFSKFEAIYARRAFPCFDEPAFKSTYDVALTIPAASDAVGNMPIARRDVLPDGRVRIAFAKTPPLPSYLVAFAVGPFEAHQTSLAATPERAAALRIGGVAMRGRGDDLAYALGEAPELIAEQEKYFGVAFPFPKVDLIAVPDFQSGAMENAGAITFRDSRLLVDARRAALDAQIGVTSVIAHELAHQWFGDLTTMRWWDDLWLNEGFATFLATRTLDAVRPAMEAELRAVGKVEDVKGLDSLASARRIRQPIETPHDITNAFDNITYDKGAAVLRMVEHYIGDAAFRRGLHDFLAAHAYGNATTDELLAALSAASGQPLAPLVASFLEQPGVPVVAAQLRCTAERNELALSQARWRAAGTTDTATQTWTVPVCVRAGYGKRVEKSCSVLDAATGAIALPGCPDWVFLNADAAGYYRSALGAPELARLRDRGLAQLSNAERVLLAHDLIAAFDSAALPADDVLRALEPLLRDRHGAVAAVPLELWRFIDQRVVDDATRPALRRRLAQRYTPLVDELTWRVGISEATARRLLRAKLFELLAIDLENPRWLAEAARRGRQLLGLEHGAPVPADLAEVALTAAVRTGGAPTFEAALAALAAADDAQLRNRLLEALAATREPALRQRALDLGLAPSLRANERVVVLKALLKSPATFAEAWTWLEAHFDAFMALLPDRAGGSIPSSLQLCDRASADRVRAFFAPRADKLTGGPRNLAQAMEKADQCIARVAAQRDAVQRYLRQP